MDDPMPSRPVPPVIETALRAPRPTPATRWRGLIVPGLATVVVTSLLVALGTWQMHRLAWKLDLIATVESRTHLAAITAPSLAEARMRDLGDLDYRPVRLAGRFLPGIEAHVAAMLGEPRGRFSGPGVWVMAPLVRDDDSIVWVNRGFVPGNATSLAVRGAPPPEGPVEIEGLLRRPEPRGAFVPADDAARNVWFVRDPAILAAGFGLDPARVAPFTVDAGVETTPSGGLPQAGETRLAFENNHLGYMLTWYGLAATCVGVFLAWARGRLKPPEA